MYKYPRVILSLLCAGSLISGWSEAQTEITLGRFFGDCEQAGTDIASAVGEACIIQSIINAFDALDDGVDVETLPTDWGNYYDQMMAMYAGGNPPDVHVMHKHRITQFASIGALTPLGHHLQAAGIDPDDWTDAARAAVSYEGEIYGVPMDLHANLWHINMDLLREAGLVNADGTPILPESPEELLDHARRVEVATGQNYLAADFSEFPIGVRLVLALVWQQDSNLFSQGEATVDSPSVRQAVETIVNLFDQGYADPRLNYADSQQAFLDGEAAVLVNGTWVVDFYASQATDSNVPLNDYYVADFPTLFDNPATWADSHMWVIPSPTSQDTDRFTASLELIAWINDHNLDWARTGHLAVRESVLGSEEYSNLPHRSEYSNTVNIARDVPQTMRYGAIQDVLNRELQSIWLTGKPIDAALADADAEIQQMLE